MITEMRNDAVGIPINGDTTRGFPLTAVQRDIWYSLSLTPNPACWNIADYREIHADIDPLQMRLALREIVTETDTLRVRFAEDADQPYQTIGPVPDEVLQYFDVSHSPDPLAAAMQWMKTETGRSIDIFRESLVTYALFKVASRHFIWYQRCHHLMMDGISGALIARRLAQRYFLQPHTDDYIGSLNGLVQADIRYRESRHFNDDRVYWLRQLEARPQPSTLSGRLPMHASEVVRRNALIPAALADALRGYAKASEASMAQLFSAITAVFLHRMTGDEDVLLGLPVSARLGKDLRQIPGMATNVIPLRVPVTSVDSISVVLGRVVRLTREGLRHQRYSQGDLRRDLGLHPVNDFLFATLVNYMPFDPSMRFGTEAFIANNLSTGPVDDLSVIVYEQAAGQPFQILFDGNAKLYTDQQLALHLHRFIYFLTSVVQHTGNIENINLVTPQEKRQLLTDWNDTRCQVRVSSFLPLFMDQVRASPDAIALSFEGVDTTYAELARQSAQLAGELQARNIGPGRVVGVALHRNPSLLTALLAVLRVGAAYLPLDPHHPPQRLAYILADADADLILCALDTLALIPTETEALCLDAPSVAAQLRQRPAVHDFAVPSFFELAYLIYTSGSTGQPKGVAVTHGSLVNFLLAMQSEIGLKQSDRLLAVTTVSFDIAGLELFLPLCCGASIQLAPRESTLDGQVLAHLSESCSVMQATPATWRLMLASSWRPRTGFKSLVGGEAVSGELTALLLGAGASVRVVYGPTETTIWSSCANLEELNFRPAVESIGKPIWNTRFYVLDNRLRLVPPGMAGELCIAGDGLARGYVGRPGQTSERFVADPFGAAGARMYRTGDLARHAADGSLEFLGRIDQQVKVRGFRIELGEIESILAASAGVEAVVVNVYQTPSDEARLVAYVVGNASHVQLRLELKDRLPDYMVPSAFVSLDRLPLTPNGKIDRKQLPAPSIDVGSERRYRGPRDAREAVLAAIVAEVLRIERVGIDDDFFAMGAHSLHMTRLVVKARQMLGIELPLGLVFSHPSVAGLTDSLCLGTVAELLPLQRPGVLPLSFAQQAFWFHEQMTGGSTAYLMPFALEFGDSLDSHALLQALRDSLECHEILRTVFVIKDGVGTVQINPAEVVPIEVRENIDWRERLNEMANTPIDLHVSPPIRLELVASETGHMVLVVVVHHIAFDGESARIWLDELGDLYRARKEGTALLCKASVVRQYVDYAIGQRRTDWEASSALAFWKSALEGAPPLLELPYDRPRPAVRRYRGAQLSFIVPTALLLEMRALANACHVTFFMFLHASLALVLARYASSGDVVVGTPVANRLSSDTECMIGPLVNTIVLRTQVDDSMSVRNWLACCRSVALAAYAHQEVPFEKVVEALKVDRAAGYNPLFQVMLVEENDTVARTQFADLELQVHTEVATSAKVDLQLAVRDTREGLHVRMEYDSDLFDAASMQQFAAHWQQLLRSMVEAPDSAIARLPVLSGAERRLLLDGFNQTQVELNQEETLTQLLESAAQHHAHAIALEFEAVRLTYSELHIRANQLAHHLCGLGVGPDVLVGVCLERSIDMVVSLLAILKAGGAYVPLDPSYPDQRLGFMIADAAPQLILTDTQLAVRLQGAPVLCLDLLVLDPAHRFAPAVNLTPANLAYVIFTSGSTGRPKGAMNSHAGIVNRLRWMQHAFGLEPLDRVLQKTPFGFDVSVWEFFWPLIEGAALVVARPEGHKDVYYLANLIQSAGITTTHFVPSMLQVFLQEPDAGACVGLRRVICSGEALAPELQRQFDATLNVPLHNLYGPTEAAVDVSHWPCTRNEHGSVPIGRPVWNTRLYVLDAFCEPVPMGVAGELFIAGIQLGRGYLRQAGLTAERFMADPHGEPGSRMYRTGDKARIRADGAIEYLGRLDDQVKLRGLRIELGEIESNLLAFPGVASASVIVREQVLIAYFTEQAGVTVGVAELRSKLKSTLPEYMVPAAFERLDALPLSPNGKLDRRALPTPTFARTEGVLQEPRNSQETLLLGVWKDLLGTDAIGIHDNFFDLGGDSILSIQMVARARRIGLQLSPQQVFAHQSIAELASVAVTAGGSNPGGPASVEGPIPLTPIQRWLVDQAGSIAHSHQALMLAIPADLDLQRLHTALVAMVIRHPTLRLKFAQGADGWKQEYLLPTQLLVPMRVVEVDDPSVEEVKSAVEQASAALDPLNGRLVQAVVFRRSTARPSRLLLLVHHLGVDGVSWRVLLEDLPALYDGADLPPTDHGFALHAQRLALRASEPSTLAELPHWLGFMAIAPAFPANPVETGPLDVVLQKNVRLSIANTHALLTVGCSAYHARMNDLLLAALAMAVARNRARCGLSPAALGMDLEGHGRDDSMDLSRSVGWFTSLFPVVLDLGDVELAQAFAGEAAAGQVICRIKEQLRTVPQAGIGFGLLRYLNADTATQFADFSPREILFNYLGRIDFGGETSWPLVWQPLASVDAELRGLTHLLEINGVLVEQQLEINWRWNGARYGEARISQLVSDYVEALHGLISHCQRPGVGGHTCSDFPLAKLDGPALLRIEKAYPGLEDVYPLMPLQHGMLFHRLLSPASAAYHQQVCLSIGGVVVPDQLQSAWQAVLDRHPALRVAVIHEDLPAPLQVVRGGLTLPWHAVDGSVTGRSAEVVAEQVEQWLALDRQRGFQLDRDVLLRVALFYGGEQQFLVFSYHHVILDGWSLPLLTGEVLQRYAASLRSDPLRLAPTTRHAHLLRWLSQQDPAVAIDFWRVRMQGVVNPTDLNLPLAEGPSSGEVHVDVMQEDFRFVERCARDLRLTLNTLVQGAWALLLMRLNGLSDVVFGATVSGRHSDVPGVESIVGMCINTLPIAVHARPGITTVEWLRELQSELAAVQGFSQVPLSELQALSTLGAGQPLFDTMVAFENYPIDSTLLHQSNLGDLKAAISVDAVRVIDSTHFGLALIVTPGEELLVRLSFDTARFDDASVRRVGSMWLELLKTMLTSPHEELAGLLLPDVRTARASSVAQRGRFGDIPWQDGEEKVAAIFSAILGRSAVARDAHFFEIGGHSLNAIQVVSRLRKAFAIDVPLRSLFDHPVVADLAMHIGQIGKGLRAATQSIRPHDGPLKLSFAQSRLWFLDQLNTVDAAYHIPVMLGFEGDLDIAILQHSLDRLLVRHEVLHSRFENVDGQPTLRLDSAPYLALTPEVFDGDEGALAVMASQESRRPFNLAGDLPIRVRLLRLAQRRHVLLLTLHHIAGDGWSVEILIKELGAL